MALGKTTFLVNIRENQVLKAEPKEGLKTQGEGRVLM